MRLGPLLLTILLGTSGFLSPPACGQYFEGWVSASLKKGPDVYSGADSKLRAKNGEIDWVNAYLHTHYIMNSSSKKLKEEVRVGLGQTASYVRIPAAYPECYRGKLELWLSATINNGFGSSQACPPEEEPEVIPDVQPGDGTGETADPRPSTPIVIDLKHDGFKFTSLTHGTFFDLDADGEPEATSWTQPEGNEAFLVLDRNGDGQVTDGRELFGDRTPQPESETPNGFAALAEFDRTENGGNEDGMITSADLVFGNLQLWQDSNQDGISQSNELSLLSWSDVNAIELAPVLSRRQDQFGNQLLWMSRVQVTRGWRLAAGDVVFIQESN